jgi:phosphoglycerate kinase
MKREYFTLNDLDVSAKRVLLRVDFNVPIKNGVIEDDTRIVMALPTIKYLLSKKAKVVILSHLGRPKGVKVDNLSLKVVSDRLVELLKRDVYFSKNYKYPNDCDLVLLENVRFYGEEEAGVMSFAKKLADMADLYVNDAFAVSHRKDASVYAITTYIKSAMGFLFEKEIKSIKEKIDNPKRPFVAILGGAKVSDKIKVVKNLVKKADKVLLGGAMIFTFYKAFGYEVGNSLYEKDMVLIAKDIIKNSGSKLVIPKDVRVSMKMDELVDVKTVDSSKISKKYYGLDIGDQTIDEYCSIITTAKTVAWNGPMGLFEMKPFDRGTNEIAKVVASSSAFSIVGGGDSISAINKIGLFDEIDHVSSGGGASLKLFEGVELSGFLALKANYKKFSK